MTIEFDWLPPFSLKKSCKFRVFPLDFLPFLPMRCHANKVWATYAERAIMANAIERKKVGREKEKQTKYVFRTNVHRFSTNNREDILYLITFLCHILCSHCVFAHNVLVYAVRYDKNGARESMRKARRGIKENKMKGGGNAPKYTSKGTMEQQKNERTKEKERRTIENGKNVH